MRLRRAYLLMHRVAQSHFSKFGATADQFVLLSFLREEEGVTQTELAERMCSDGNTVTAMLKLLEEKGCVRRERCEQDGRARRVHLTTAGKRLERKLHRGSETLRMSIEQAVTGTERKQLNACLDQIIQSITAQTSDERRAS